MIVRLWHGRVAATKAQAYREFLTRRAIPDYRSPSGSDLRSGMAEAASPGHLGSRYNFAVILAPGGGTLPGPSCARGLLGRVRERLAIAQESSYEHRGNRRP
jgi:hypothetical protein